MKYASKGVSEHEKFPKHCRLFGVYNVPIALGWWRCPVWMAEIGLPGENIKQMGTWWVNWDTGYGYKTPWVVNSIRGNEITVTWRGWGIDDKLPIEEVRAQQDINSALHAYYKRKRREG